MEAAGMTKKEQLYEGKAKKVFATDDPELLIVSYKDDATAFNGLKKGTIAGKGIINNQMSNALMRYLSAKGIPTPTETATSTPRILSTSSTDLICCSFIRRIIYPRWIPASFISPLLTELTCTP